MKNADKAYPYFDLEIGGETVGIICDWKTIYNYEKLSGRGFTSLLEGTSFSVCVDFLHAAIGHKKKEYTKEWILKHFNKDLWMKIGAEVIPHCLKAAMVDSETEESEKNVEGETTPK